MAIAVLGKVPAASPSAHSSLHLNVVRKGDKENGSFDDVEQNKE